MGIAKITRNYQITLPKDVREMQNLKEGDCVIFNFEGRKVSLVKANKDALQNAAGIWNLKETGAEYQKKIRDVWVKRKKREFK